MGEGTRGGGGGVHWMAKWGLSTLMLRAMLEHSESGIQVEGWVKKWTQGGQILKMFCSEGEL